MHPNWSADNVSAVPMERIMRSFTTRLILSAMIVVFSTSAASALTLNANIDGVFTDSTFSTLVSDYTPDGAGNATATLAAGNGVVVTIDVANPDAEAITAIFASLTVQGQQVSALLGTILPTTMLKGDGLFGKSLADVGTGGIKGNSPNQLGGSGDVWIQGIGYALQEGTDGTGPDTIELFFVLGGVGANEQVAFVMGLTAGDAIADPSSIGFDSAAINAPEPGSFALALASLGTVGLIGRIRRRA
jgi:hypothetical protein